MKKCNFCKVKIIDETDHCPLCGSVLEGNEDGENRFPDILKKESALNFIYRLMLFISIVAIVTCVGINITTGQSTKWSLIVAVAFLYALLIIKMFARENAGYRVRTFGICAFGLFLVIVIDYILGAKRWSVNYVFPALIMLLVLSLIILMIVNHRNWQSYILLLFAMVIISVIPVILYHLGIVTNPYPSQIAFSFTLIVTVGTLILGGPRVKSELYRRFHIMGK